MKFSIILLCICLIQFAKSDDDHEYVTKKYHADKFVQNKPCNDYNTLKYSAPFRALNIEEAPEEDHSVHPPDAETNAELPIHGLEEAVSSQHPPELHPESAGEESVEHVPHPTKGNGGHPVPPVDPHESSSDHIPATPPPPSSSNPPNLGSSNEGKEFRPSQPIDSHAGGSEYGSGLYFGHPHPHFYQSPPFYPGGHGFYPYYYGGSSFSSSGYGKSFSSSPPVSHGYPSSGYYPGGSIYYSSKGSGSHFGESESRKSYPSTYPVPPAYHSPAFHAGESAFKPSQGSGSSSDASEHGKSYSSAQPVFPVYPSPGFYSGGHGFYASHGSKSDFGSSGSGKSSSSSSQPVHPVYPSQSIYPESGAFYAPHQSGSATESGKSFATSQPILPSYPPLGTQTEGKVSHASHSSGGPNYGRFSYPAYPQVAIYPQPGVVYKPVFTPANPKEPVASPNQNKAKHDSYGPHIYYGGELSPGYTSYAPGFHFFKPQGFTPAPYYPIPPKSGPSFYPQPYQPKDKAPYPSISYPPKPEHGFYILPYPAIYGPGYNKPQPPKTGSGFHPQPPQSPKQSPSFNPPQLKPPSPGYSYEVQSKEKGYEYQHSQPGKGYSYQHGIQYSYSTPQQPSLGKSNGVQSSGGKGHDGFQYAFYPGPYFNSFYPPHPPKPKTIVYYVFVEDVKPVIEYSDHIHPELPARLRLPKDHRDTEESTKDKGKKTEDQEPESTTYRLPADIVDIPPEQLKVMPHPKPLTPEEIKLIVDLAHNKAMEHHLKNSNLPPAVSTQFFSRVYPSPKNATHMETKMETFEK